MANCSDKKGRDTKILISDGLLIKKEVKDVKHILKKGCLIEEVQSLVRAENPGKNTIFFISVGSLNVTAKGCGWDYSIIKNKSNLLEDAFAAFKQCLMDLHSLRMKKRCVMRVCGLLPIPADQELIMLRRNRKN